MATASGVGIGVGVAVLALYVVAGLVVAEWSLASFFARLTPGTGAALLVAGCLVVACFALPIAAYLYDGLRSPLAVLVVVLVGWLVYGLGSGVLTPETVFGFTIYWLYFVPLYLVLYAVVAGVEYYLTR